MTYLFIPMSTKKGLCCMNNNRLNYSKYRLEKAKEDLTTAIIDFKSGHFSASVNRSYYCIFHSMRAILALDGFDSKKHSGVIAYFRENYIKTKILDRVYSDIVGDAFEIRNNGDYVDFFIIHSEDAKEQLENARLFIDEVESYLKVVWENTENE